VTAVLESALAAYSFPRTRVGDKTSRQHPCILPQIGEGKAVNYFLSKIHACSHTAFAWPHILKEKLLIPTKTFQDPEIECHLSKK
jgi:hypothetical protein